LCVSLKSIGQQIKMLERLQHISARRTNGQTDGLTDGLTDGRHFHIPAPLCGSGGQKQLFDLEVKGQGPTKVITVRDTPSYGHAPTY